MVDRSIHTNPGVPLLETKLYAPPWRSGLVSRQRLIERIHQGVTRKLTLISAPAGFGKTTLLAEWLADAENAGPGTGWVSLAPSDNDPSLFWTYFISALRNVQPDIGERALSLLHTPQPPPIEVTLTTLINELSPLEGDVAFVLDDYHVIENELIHNGLGYLLDHMPPHVHAVIASRTSPPLHLARLRARGELTELRAPDLRFNLDEAALFLNDITGLDLSPDVLTTLEARTEGWIAGLQLAALSMQGREDRSGFVRAFAGDDRYIVDYLLEEVLQRQDEEIRRFLLCTSILDRLSGPLCDAVADREHTIAMLDTLERDNLFIVPLDDKRHWYRYHHLFADVLRSNLAAHLPDLLPGLHRRASLWFEEHGFLPEAIHHALEGQDFDRVANLAEKTARSMITGSQEMTWYGWVKALPDELISARPVLNIYYAFTLLNEDIRAAEDCLDHIERLIRDSPPAHEKNGAADLCIAAEDEFRSTPGMIAVARAYIAGAYGDEANSIRYARQALELLPETDTFWRGAATTLLGIAYWTEGNLDSAADLVTDGVAGVQSYEDLSSYISTTLILGDIRIAQGRLAETERLFQQALQRTEDQGDLSAQGLADLHVIFAEIHRIRGDFDAARQHLAQSEVLGDHTALRELRHRRPVVKALIESVSGNYDAALDLLDESERLYLGNPNPEIRPVEAVRARIWLAQGRLPDARNWILEQGLTSDDELVYPREYEHITLARSLIAHYKKDKDEAVLEEALAFLARLLKAAEDGGRPGSTIELLVLLSLAHHAQDHLPAALSHLERALIMAEPEGFASMFVDEGAVVQELLRHTITRGVAAGYARSVLKTFSDMRDEQPPVQPSLVSPLTKRELEVLRLIAAGLRNQEIADHLFISISTVKRHIANVYGKLDVSHRTEAIARASTMNLL